MKIIVIALLIEARPLINALKLKKCSASPTIPLYSGKDIRLVICGTGKLKASVATSYALAREMEPKKIVAINFGFCGSADPRVPLGDLYMINKITDAATGRSFFPDILHKHGLPESALTTYEKPVTRAEDGVKDLVDMEGSGFFAATSIFLGPERIFCLKLVSDHLEGRRLDKDRLSELIDAKLPKILSLLDICDALIPHRLGFKPEEEDLVTALCNRLRLTVTQTHQLRDWARAYVIRHKQGLDVLKPHLEQTANTTNERNRALAVIKDELLAS